MTRSQALLRAFGGKLNLGVLCATAGGAAIIESYFVLFLGLVAFTGLVIRDVHNGRRRPYHTFPRMPHGSTFSNGAIRSAIDGIGAAQRERAEVLRSCPEEILRMLDDILRAAVEAEAAAVRLAKRTDRLHGYLSTKDLPGIKETLYAAQQSARLAKSQHEREIYEAAARTYEAEVETLASIELGIRVALAKLENLRAALAVVPPRIVRLSATSADLGDVASNRLFEELRVASLELEEAEERFLMLARSAEHDATFAGERAGAPHAVRIALVKETVDEVMELDGLAQLEHVSSRRFSASNAVLGR